MLNAACSITDVAPRMHVGAAARAPRNAIAAILTPDDILLDVDLPTKSRAFEEIARFVAARHALVGANVLASLATREEIGSTGLGCGVAVPHARVEGLSRPIAAFARTRFPIPFDAPDGKPVSDMFALLVPRHATETHLLLLAGVADMFCDKAFREDLRTRNDATEVHAAFAQWHQP
jgi:PTS system nitrogen regulatory IIA component